MAEVADDDRHELVEAARAQGGLTVADLWLRYLALGGTGDLFDVDGYLAGVLQLRRFDQNALAVAVNERLEECYRAARVPLTSARPTTPPAVAMSDIIADLLRPAGARATAPRPSPADPAPPPDPPSSSGERGAAS